jgi:hypothetical protein
MVQAVTGRSTEMAVKGHNHSHDIGSDRNGALN